MDVPRPRCPIRVSACSRRRVFESVFVLTNLKRLAVRIASLVLALQYGGESIVSINSSICPTLPPPPRYQLIFHLRQSIIVGHVSRWVIYRLVIPGTNYVSSICVTRVGSVFVRAHVCARERSCLSIYVRFSNVYIRITYTHTHAHGHIHTRTHTRTHK